VDDSGAATGGDARLDAGLDSDVDAGAGLDAGAGFDAFEGFARRERRALIAFAWSLTGDRAAAEDLAQEALQAAWQRWDDVGDYDKPGAWARRVIANRAATRARRSGRERRALSRLASRRVEPVELSPADDRFWAEVRRLPERQAQSVSLHYLEDRSVAEIAEVLGCAEGTVKVHLHRGRLALARALGLLDDEEDDR
jgi:RNA polymerase sigma-70 factor (ECF subfamily)